MDSTSTNIQKPTLNGVISALKSEHTTVEKLATEVGIFTIKKGSQWLQEAMLKPTPKALYGAFWNEGETCFMFAETNAGKSIKAVQIAENISHQQPVIYFDFELSDKQFENRYSDNYTNHYQFQDNFLRAEINIDNADYEEAGFENMEDYICDSIERAVKSTGVKVIIVDNITYLGTETEKSKSALPLMKRLNRMKKQHGLSLLVLAHTPKRNQSQPLTINDMAGSKNLMNFCDSAFAIGESAKDPNLRYLKQIKSRNAVKEFNAENVAVYEITKRENFLAFTLVHTSCEREHLKQYTEDDRTAFKDKAIELSRSGKSQREIANELNIAVGTVNKYIRNNIN